MSDGNERKMKFDILMILIKELFYDFNSIL